MKRVMSYQTEKMLIEHKVQVLANQLSQANLYGSSFSNHGNLRYKAKADESQTQTASQFNSPTVKNGLAKQKLSPQRQFEKKANVTIADANSSKVKASLLLSKLDYTKAKIFSKEIKSIVD